MSGCKHHGKDAASAISARAVWQRVLLALLLVLGMLLPLHRTSFAAETAAVGVRIGGDEVRTRFVADLSDAVSYTVYVLPDPYRVMIDMPGVRFDLPPDSGTKTRGLISAFRYGEVEEGRSRIVIDTDGPVLIEKSFIVDRKNGQPARIVVDLVKSTPEAFRAAYKSD
ncbi:MAG: AMIN domain-containing protein, partial [Aestuariivirga sp.]